MANPDKYSDAVSAALSSRSREVLSQIDPEEASIVVSARDLPHLAGWGLATLAFLALAVMGLFNAGSDNEVIVSLNSSNSENVETANLIDQQTTASIKPANSGKTNKFTAPGLKVGTGPLSNNLSVIPKKPVETTKPRLDKNGFERVEFVNAGSGKKSGNTAVPDLSAGAVVGIDLGGGGSFSKLSRRFLEIANGAPEIFDGLQAKGNIRESNGGLEARLVVGPFASLQAAQETCKKLKSRVDTECNPADFSGQILIAR